LTSRPRGAAGDQAAAPVRDRENDLRIRDAVAAKMPLHQIIAGQRLAPSSALRTKPSIAFAKRRCGMRVFHVAVPAPAMEQRSMMAAVLAAAALTPALSACSRSQHPIRMSVAVLILHLTSVIFDTENENLRTTDPPIMR
jgi:hypothetical protein